MDHKENAGRDTTTGRQHLGGWMQLQEDTITDSPSPDGPNRQLPYADLVHQVPPPAAPEHPLPVPDKTIKTLFYWAMDLDIPHGPRLALLTILRHINWEKGDHCTAGIQTLAREAQFSRKTLNPHFPYG